MRKSNILALLVLSVVVLIFAIIACNVFFAKDKQSPSVVDFASDNSAGNESLNVTEDEKTALEWVVVQ